LRRLKKRIEEIEYLVQKIKVKKPNEDGPIINMRRAEQAEVLRFCDWILSEIENHEEGMEQPVFNSREEKEAYRMAQLLEIIGLMIGAREKLEEGIFSTFCKFPIFFKFAIRTVK